MRRNIPALTGACVLGIALGFAVGKWNNPQVVDSNSSIPIAKSEGRLPSRSVRSRVGNESEILSDILNGRSANDFTPAELAKIIGTLSKYDADIDPVRRARQSYQMASLVAQLSPEQLEDIASVAILDKEIRKTVAMHTILSELASKDTDRALAWVSNQEYSSSLIGAVISKIAETDPDRASVLFRKSLIEGTIGGSSVWQASHSISRATAKQGALPLIEFIDSLPGRIGSSMLYNSIQFLPEGEEGIFLDEYFSRKDDASRDRNSFDNVFSQFAMKNPEAAGAWLENVTDAKLKASLQSQAAVSMIQSENPEDADKWMKLAFESSPGREKELFVSATRNMVYNAPEKIAELAKSLPPEIELTADDLSQDAMNVFNVGGASIAHLADAIPNPDEKAKLITKTLTNIANQSSRMQSLGSTDLEILSQKISRMGFTGQNLENVNSSLDAIRRFGNQ